MHLLIFNSLRGRRLHPQPRPQTLYLVPRLHCPSILSSFHREQLLFYLILLGDYYRIIYHSFRSLIRQSRQLTRIEPVQRLVLLAVGLVLVLLLAAFLALVCSLCQPHRLSLSQPGTGFIQRVWWIIQCRSRPLPDRNHIVKVSYRLSTIIWCRVSNSLREVEITVRLLSRHCQMSSISMVWTLK